MYKSWLSTWHSGKESAHDEGDLGLNPRLGSSLGEGRGSGLENSMDRGAWQATAHGATKSQTRLGTHAQ